MPAGRQVPRQPALGFLGDGALYAVLDELRGISIRDNDHFSHFPEYSGDNRHEFWVGLLSVDNFNDLADCLPDSLKVFPISLYVL